MRPELHPAFKVQKVWFGNEQQPLIIVDNFLAQAKTLIDYAMQGQVLTSSGGYPGMRSLTPELYKDAIRQHLGSLICATFGINLTDISQIESYFSLVTTPAKQLSPAQQIPHFDRPQQNEIAMLHYLCDDTHGGTSFYRHRETGYEYIDQARQAGYLATLQRQLPQGLLPQPAAYINGDTSAFERICSQSAQFNRVLIYRCSSLHSGDIDADYPFNLDPYTGRFTIASFLSAGS